MQRVWRGLWGARSFFLTGCFINVIKHGRALWLCIIPDLHSRGKRGREEKEGETDSEREGKGGRGREGVSVQGREVGITRT